MALHTQQNAASVVKRNVVIKCGQESGQRRKACKRSRTSQNPAPGGARSTAPMIACTTIGSASPPQGGDDLTIALTAGAHQDLQLQRSAASGQDPPQQHRPKPRAGQPEDA